jgi:hypothetical protein
MILAPRWKCLLLWNRTSRKKVYKHDVLWHGYGCALQVGLVNACIFHCISTSWYTVCFDCCLITAFVWLAAQRLNSASPFVWNAYPNSADSLTYNNWDTGYPYITGGSNCVVMNAANGLWQNIPCALPYTPFVYALCEITWLKLISVDYRRRQGVWKTLLWNQFREEWLNFCMRG